MTDDELLQVASLGEYLTVRALLETLESRVPLVRIFDASDETVVCFPLPGQRKHSVSFRECRLGDGPRVWQLSASVGTLDSLSASGFSIEDYNSQADLGFANVQEGVVRVQTQLVKAHSPPVLVVVTAYSLARQADALEQRASDRDEL